jgi:hypothetical protein
MLTVQVPFLSETNHDRSVFPTHLTLHKKLRGGFRHAKRVINCSMHHHWRITRLTGMGSMATWGRRRQRLAYRLIMPCPGGLGSQFFLIYYKHRYERLSQLDLNIYEVGHQKCITADRTSSPTEKIISRKCNTHVKSKI